MRIETGTATGIETSGTRSRIRVSVIETSGTRSRIRVSAIEIGIEIEIGTEGKIGEDVNDPGL